jgi:hypothetical protein
LAGASPQEAFFVRCDLRETVSDGVATQQLNCAIGVAFADPGLKLPRSMVTQKWVRRAAPSGGSPP